MCVTTCNPYPRDQARMKKSKKWFVLAFSLANVYFAQAQDAGLEKAENLFSAKQYPAALTELEKTSPVSQADKETIAYYMTMCRIYMGNQDAGKSVDDFVKQYPASIRKVEMVTTMADELFNRGRYEEAVKYYDLTDKFSMGQPRRDDYVFRKAYSLYASGDYPAARPLMYSLLESPKWGADAAYAFGHMCYAEGDMALALENFLKVKDDPKYAGKIPFYLTNIYFKQKKYDQAIGEGLEVLKKTPDAPDAPAIGKIVGQSYFNAGRFKEALPYLTKYLGDRTPTAEENYQIGYAYYKCGEYPQAVEYLSRLVGQDSQLAQSAYFALGQSYLGMGKKAEALGAFRSASRMDHNAELKQDAWYNYAVLSYEAGNPYEPASKVLSEYLSLYPESPNKDQVFDYLLDSFISSKDYQEAINTIESMGLDSPRATEALAKASFYLAAQKLNAEDYDAALKYYRKASLSAADAALKARSDFWLAETYLRVGLDDQASAALTDFKSNPASRNTPEYRKLPYQQGYLAEKSGDYASAQNYFYAYEKLPALSGDEKADVQLHLADCAFALGQYSVAMALYEKVAVAGVPSSDYATYQKALCQGITGNYNGQIASLTAFLKNYPASPWRAAARYQMGMAYQKIGQTDKAIESYLQVGSEKAAGDLIPEAKSKAALAYYNQGNSDKALALYKEVVEKYPSSPVTPSATRSVRQILVEQGRSDEFVTWSDNTSGTPLDQMSVDSLYFETGQKAFSKGDYAGASKAFAQYVEKYPSGLFTTDAAYYLAESSLKSGDTTAAKTDYKRLLGLPDNKFTEGATVKYVELLRAQDSLDVALPYLEKLFGEARIADNRKFALVNLLSAYTQAEDWDNTVKYAGLIRREFPSTSQLYADASVALYGALVEDDQADKAKALTEELKKICSGENMAKTLYYEALLQYRDGQYDKSVETIAKLTLEYPMYKHIGSRALLLMAQNFCAQGDKYQAGYILQNILDSSPYEDIKAEARALKDFMDSQEKTTGEKNTENLTE